MICFLYVIGAVFCWWLFGYLYCLWFVDDDDEENEYEECPYE
ncbi:Uncharacterised protein [Enterobacter hormaechei]|nr:hypothetical protein AI2772V1_2018 [Enterobacter cloacae]CZU37574.1 Uncharacterised protein [Enterobacter hormaechei]CAH3661153.1 hypothetical protein AI2772V1_2018 [Enterobacter cloacae]CZU46665.1 Uncharacterised protein [Enterobacter hormaechei]CZU48000.1 Uncharacterised protein [Enterobacter hormaechei]